jgi:hypothetical integral membrane protein (TIGR02206 family)
VLFGLAQRTFVAYGPSHWVLIGVLLAGALVFGVLGGRVRDPRPVARTFAVVIVAFQLPLLVYRLLPAQFDVAVSLPFHLCDIAWPVAAHALWRQDQRTCALTYYWGLTLAPQAVFTPALDAPDFPHVDFIEFWGQHLLVVWSAVFLTWRVGLRPNWRGYRLSVAVTVGWGLLVLGFNSSAGTNYGFVNSKPDNPSLLDLMGGWPWYLVVELVVGMAAWALLTWPWTRSRDHGMAKPC